MIHLSDAELLDLLDQSVGKPGHERHCDFCAARLRMLGRGAALYRAAAEPVAADGWPRLREALRVHRGRSGTWTPIAAAASLALAGVCLAFLLDRAETGRKTAGPTLVSRPGLEVARARKVSEILFIEVSSADPYSGRGSSDSPDRTSDVLSQSQRQQARRQVERLLAEPDPNVIDI